MKEKNIYMFIKIKCVISVHKWCFHLDRHMNYKKNVNTNIDESLCYVTFPKQLKIAKTLNFTFLLHVVPSQNLTV